MKPTLWYSDGAWLCSSLCLEGLPPENTDEYVKWACIGEGSSPQEAYTNWEHECDLFRGELSSDKSNS